MKVNSYYKSPSVPVQKYELSPIINNVNFVSEVCAYTNTRSNKGPKNCIFQIPFPETPSFKADVKCIEKEQKKESLSRLLQYTCYELGTFFNHKNDKCRNILSSLKRINNENHQGAQVINFGKNANSSEPGDSPIKEKRIFNKPRNPIKKKTKKQFTLNSIKVDDKQLKYNYKNDHFKISISEELYRKHFKREKYQEEPSLEAIFLENKQTLNTTKFTKQLKCKLNSLVEDGRLDIILTDDIKEYGLNKKSIESLYETCLSSLKNQIEQICGQRKIPLLEKELNSISEQIYQINIFANVIMQSIKKSKTKKKKYPSRIQYFEFYECSFCKRRFDTGQGLGGHISRVHPNQSKTYRKRKLKRESRTELRQVLQEARKQLIEKLNIQCDDVDSKKANELVRDNYKEFKIILNNIKHNK
jgi:hypothetical protein